MKLTKDEYAVIVEKATERPFSGIYNEHFEEGLYCCKRCKSALFKSSQKFRSMCGWPSFDEALAGAVKEIPDSDGVRTEIVCAACQGHLGHIFRGELLTRKNTRYCVNSISLYFKPGKV